MIQDRLGLEVLFLTRTSILLTYELICPKFPDFLC